MSLENVTAFVPLFVASLFPTNWTGFNQTLEVVKDIVENGTDTTAAQLDLTSDIYKLAISGTTGAFVAVVLIVAAFLYYCLVVKRVRVRFWRGCDVNPPPAPAAAPAPPPPEQHAQKEEEDPGRLH